MYLLNTWRFKDHESKCGEHSKCNKYNLMIKNPPFRATERSISGQKVQSYFPFHG